MASFSNRKWRWQGLVALALAAGFVSGCSTTSGSAKDQQDEARTAEQVAQSRFRARWWNFYDRAVAYQVLEEWESAEADLRNAMAQRSRDQRWARTYGLHFTPEYFPKRELGFALYKQGKLEEALEFLEQSHTETPTARAAYYIDECRSTLVSQSGTDSAAPTVALLSPDPGQSVAALFLNGEVSVSDDTFVRHVWINDEPYRDLRVSASGAVTVPFVAPMNPGRNEVSIRVEDIAGKSTTQTFAFSTDLDGPAVSFDSPIVVPGTVSGVVYDSAGVEAFEVAGRALALTPDGSGALRFEAAVSETDLAEGLAFRAQDANGNVTRDTVALDALVRAGRTGGFEFASHPSQETLPLGVQEIPLPDGGVAYVRLQVAATAEGEPRVEYVNLEEGRTITSEELVALLDLTAPSPIAKVVLGGTEISDVIPGRRTFRITRRVRLELGENVITTVITDTEGRSATASIKVIREESAIDAPGNKLALAVLGNYWKDLTQTAESISPEILASVLTRDLDEQGRFNLVGRGDELAAVLQELELSAIVAEGANRLEAGRLLNAELLVAGQMQVIDKGLNLSLQVIDSETSEITVVDAFANLANQDPSDAVNELSANLVLLLEQLYPRVKGKILAQRGEDLYAEITNNDGVQPNAKCLVFREITVDLGNGIVESDSDMLSERSLLTRVLESSSVIRPEEPITLDESGIENLYVVTK